MSNSKRKKGKKVKPKSQKNTQLDIFKSMRKPMPRGTKVINPKKIYDRKNKSWMNTDDDD